ncbi:MAG: hypothetical protein ACREQA_20770 [Candidatus Binatia bacterium]
MGVFGRARTIYRTARVVGPEKLRQTGLKTIGPLVGAPSTLGYEPYDVEISYRAKGLTRVAAKNEGQAEKLAPQKLFPRDAPPITKIEAKQANIPLGKYGKPKTFTGSGAKGEAIEYANRRGMQGYPTIVAPALGREGGWVVLEGPRINGEKKAATKRTRKTLAS